MAKLTLAVNEDDGDWRALYVDGVLTLEGWNASMQVEDVLKELTGVMIDSFEIVKTSLPFIDEEDNELADPSWPEKWVK